jgi:hypothetical protein
LIRPEHQRGITAYANHRADLKPSHAAGLPSRFDLKPPHVAV